MTCKPNKRMTVTTKAPRPVAKPMTARPKVKAPSFLRSKPKVFIKKGVKVR